MSLLPRPTSTLLLLLLCALWLWPGSPAAAQAGEAEDVPVPSVVDELPTAPVAEIRVEGNRRVDREAIVANMASEVGAPLSRQALQRDIEKIFDMGFFSDVELRLLQAEEVQAPGPVVLVKVTEKPAVREVRYEGLDAVSESDLEEVVQVQPFAILDRSRVDTTADAIAAKYREKGYYLAEVDWRLVPVPAENAVDVVFTIEERRKVMVKEIRFVGNQQVPDEAIEQFLETREGGYLNFLTGAGTYKEEAFERDRLRIQQVYFDRGFVDLKVGRPQLTLSADKQYLFITIPVEEGVPYDVGEVGVSGEDLILDEERLERTLGLRSGRRFSRTALIEDVQRLQEQYRNLGYAYVNVAPMPQVDRENQTISIDYQIEKGERVYIERIEIRGNTRTRDKVIRREMRIDEGDRYSGTAVEASRQRVTALGYFETVEIASRPGTGSDDIVLEVTVDERPTGTFQVGAGLSSGEGIIATAQISHDNLFGRGQSLALQLQYSSLRTIFQLQFTEPHFLDTDWTLAGSAFNTRSDYISFISVRTGGSLTAGYDLDPWIRNLRMFLTYSLENIREEFDQPIPSSLAAEGVTSGLKATLSYDSRNDRLFPSRGQYHTVAVEHAPPWLGSENEFTRYTVIGRGYWPLPYGVVGRLKLEMGLITGDRFSLSDRYFLGGIYSLRGYPLRDITPRVPFPTDADPTAGTSEFRIGGNKQLLLNAELEFPLVAALGLKGVVFYDVGNAFADDAFWFEDQRYDLPLGLFHSIGFGARWFSPIGPLRFEWGIPLTPRPDRNDKLRFEFTVGNFF